MNFHRFCLVVCLVFGGMPAGCSSPPPKPQNETSASQATRDNCYSLLHQVLEQEKDVSVLRFFKHEDSDLKNLIIKVSAVAGTAAAKLEKFAKEDTSLALEDYRLPSGETKTRASIKAAEEKTLLHGSGENFERALVLTQVEALNYASHLAKVAGENDFQSDRARFLAALSTELQGLHDELVTQLSVRQ